jgi:putative PIG3 family NAD(P)H quinone oxidoreductase
MSMTPSIPATMLAVVAPTPGGPEALQVVERPVPKPGCGEVLIKIGAAGVNGADVSQRRGKYPLPPGTPDILGLECAGTVVAVGEAVSEWTIGAQVCALLIGGGYAEYCAVAAVQCLPIPAGVTPIEAAGLPEVAMTVWSNVFEIGRLAPGETILVHGGASGIGTHAIQLAKRLGARVLATAGTDAKCRRCEELGAVKAINYRMQDFVAEARRVGAVDVILDMVGGDYIQRGLELLAPGGRLVMLALKQGARLELDCGLIQSKNLYLTGSRLRPRPIAEKGRLVAAVRKAVWPLIESGDIKPIIDSTYQLREAAAAHARMESGEHVGKVVLVV